MAAFQECPVKMPGGNQPLIASPARGIPRPGENYPPRRGVVPLGPMAAAPVSSEACCPIPAIDWRPINQSPTHSAGSSGALPYTASPPNGPPFLAPRVRAGSGPLAPVQSPEGWHTLNVSPTARSQRITFSGDRAGGSPVGPEATQRRSMSSLCPSVAEARMEARMEARSAQQLQNAKHISPSSSQAYSPVRAPGAPGAATSRERVQYGGTPLMPQRGPGGGGRAAGAPGSGEMEPKHGMMHDNLKRNPSDGAPVAYPGGTSDSGIPRATSVPSGSESACANWAEVEALCANMDMAGVTLEGLDIMCLPLLADEAREEAAAGEEGLPNASTMMSLKFSNMALKHYPGDQNTKQMFQNVLSS